MKDRMPYHIDLFGRKVFVFRQAIDHVFIENSIRVMADGTSVEPEIISALRDQLLLSANTNPSVKDNTVALDKCVENLVEDASDTIRKTFDRNKHGDALIRDLQNEIENISCRRCAKKAGLKPCCGADKDFSVVESSGQCLNSIKNLYTWAYKNSLDFYLSHAINPATVNKLNNCMVELDTEKYCDKPHDLPAPYSVSGSTHYKDEGCDRCSIVTLHIQTAEIDWPSILASAHVLAHELVVHVFQGLDTTSSEEREEASASEYFSEGWMEYVTYKLISKWTPLRDYDGISDHAKIFHTAKCVVTGDNFSPTTQQCSLGRKTAQEFEYKMLPLCSDKSEIDFFELSALLNLADVNLNYRTNFVLALYDIYTELRLPRKEWTERVSLFKKHTENFVNKRIEAAQYVIDIVDMTCLSDAHLD